MEPFFNRLCFDVARQKRTFQNLIEKEFEPIIKSAKKQNKFDWDFLKKFYNFYATELYNLYSLRIFCEYSFQLFFKFSCDDHELVIKVIRLYIEVICQYGILELCRYCKQFNFPKHYHHEDIMFSRSILRDVNKVSVNTYSFINRELYSRLTVSAIYVGDYPFLQFLVKYGLSYSPDDKMHQARLELGTLYSNYTLLKPREGSNGIAEREHFSDSILMRLLTELEKPNWRRINLIVLAVDISLCKCTGDLYYPDYVECLNFYALTLPEAEISVKDVQDFLDLAFPNDGVFIDETVSNFKEVFPNCPKVSSPRTLKYLSRCKVRNCIKDCTSLTTVLSELEIPTTVKDYLLYLSD